VGATSIQRGKGCSFWQVREARYVRSEEVGEGFKCQAKGKQYIFHEAGERKIIQILHPIIFAPRLATTNQLAEGGVKY